MKQHSNDARKWAPGAQAFHPHAIFVPFVKGCRVR